MLSAVGSLCQLIMHVRMNYEVTISSPFPDLQVCGSSVSADSTYVQHMNIEGTSKCTYYVYSSFMQLDND